MKTTRTKASEITRDWYVLDAGNKPLGRVASRVARILMGKHKAQFEPFLDTGDFVVVLNAQKIYVQDNKRRDKFYYRHTGYPGGIKQTSLEKMLGTKPEEVIRLAVKGMLPKNRLGRKMIKKLKVYGGESHPHEAQGPKELTV